MKPENYQRTVVEVDGKKYTLVTYTLAGIDQAALFYTNGRKVKNAQEILYKLIKAKTA